MQAISDTGKEEGLDALLPGSLIEAGKGGRPSQGSVCCLYKTGWGSGNGTGFRAHIAGFHSSTDS